MADQTLLHRSAYCTNPSDITFRRFLTELSTHDHFRHLSCPATRSSNALGQLTSRPRSTSDGDHLIFDEKVSISLRTQPYHRQDFFVGSLVCVNHRPVDLNPIDGSEDEDIPSSEWFLGCFGSWWSLDWRYNSNRLQSIWQRWLHGQDPRTLLLDLSLNSGTTSSGFRVEPCASDSRTKTTKKKKSSRSRKKSPLLPSPTCTLGSLHSQAHPKLDSAG